MTKQESRKFAHVHPRKLRPFGYFDCVGREAIAKREARNQKRGWPPGRQK